MLAAFCAVLFFLLSVVVPCSKVSAADYLDIIKYYGITVDVDSDGSMRMTYVLKWKVLDDKKEGPLEWIKIGIANKYVRNITAVSSNIKSAKYYSSGGDYVRIDLDKKYYAGDEIYIEFSLIQDNVFSETFSDTELGQARKYDFTAGWFPETPVEQYELKWNKDKVGSVSGPDAPDQSDPDYYSWTGKLDPGSKVNVVLTYKADSFAFKHYDSQNSSGSEAVGIVFIVIIAMIIAISILVAKASAYDSGRWGRGEGRNRTYVHGSHYRGGSHGGGHCACACACACAGGGRAGCSKKDFYGTKLRTARIREAIKAGKNQDRVS